MKSARFRELARTPNAGLEALLRGSKAPAFATIVGSEWCGFNTPPTTRLLGIQKFIKGFFQGPQAVEGYNTPAVQNGLEGPWVARPSAENPKRFGFYSVTSVDRAARDNFYPEALLLDYGASARNPSGAIERSLRDYLVQPNAADADILLGKAYFALWGWRIPAGYFILERRGSAAWKP